jgi:hypothetical protein
MELAGRLHQLTAAELAPVVQDALRDDHAWPLTWEFDALDWTGNPATVGLFRLAGIARTSGGGEVPWIVVLKVVADVDLTGDPLIDRYTHEPEGLTIGSEKRWPSVLGCSSAGPGPWYRCIATESRRNRRARRGSGLEAREGAGPHALWTIEQLASAAYDFGALAAQWQSKRPDVRHYPWLAQRWLRGWVALVRIYAVDHFP